MNRARNPLKKAIVGKRAKNTSHTHTKLRYKMQGEL